MKVYSVRSFSPGWPGKKYVIEGTEALPHGKVMLVYDFTYDGPRPSRTFFGWWRELFPSGRRALIAFPPQPPRMAPIAMDVPLQACPFR